MVARWSFSLPPCRPQLPPGRSVCGPVHHAAGFAPEVRHRLLSRRPSSRTPTSALPGLRLAGLSRSQPGGVPAPASRADSAHQRLPSHRTAAARSEAAAVRRHLQLLITYDLTTLRVQSKLALSNQCGDERSVSEALGTTCGGAGHSVRRCLREGGRRARHLQSVLVVGGHDQRHSIQVPGPLTQRLGDAVRARLEPHHIHLRAASGTEA